MITATIKKDTRKLQALIRQAPADIEDRLATAAFDAEAYVIRSFGTSPSAPGSPPGIDTGTLRASIRAEKRARLMWAIVCGVDYGIHLEYGTHRGLLPRPFMLPMALWLQKQMPSYFKDVW
jgi:hypothetical protein